MSPEKRALLLVGPQHYNETKPISGRIRRTYEHLDPLGIAIVSAFLKKYGIKTRLEVMEPGRIDRCFQDSSSPPDFLFVSARHFDASLVQEAMGKAKAAFGDQTKIVVGGYSPTFNPERFPETDVIVQGEFEPVAEAVIDGLLTGTFEYIYDSRATPLDMNHYTYPDRTIFPKFPPGLERLRRHTQEWMRGCLNRCSFCSPSRMQGSLRSREPQDIIAEIEKMGLQKGDHLFSVDLNTMAIPQETLYELFAYLKNKGIRWYTEGTVRPLLENLKEQGSEKSLLKLMSPKPGPGGCHSFLYGADDLTLAKVKGSKDKELTDLARAIAVFKEMGIPLNLSLIVGLDNHKFPATFYQYAQTVQELLPPYVFFQIATPYTGTSWGNQVAQEGRIFDSESLHYTHSQPVMIPEQMTAEQLQQGYYWLLRTCYNPEQLKEIAKANIDPTSLKTNPLLSIFSSGLPWGTVTLLALAELSARGHINKEMQRELDNGYKTWLSRG